jgi:RNA-directed DNA polymerase
MEEKLAPVPKVAKQAREAQDLRSWVEPAVWNDRMLTALVTGVKGGKWFSLIDKVYSPKALRAAFIKVKRNQGRAGVDHQTIEMFEHGLEENLSRLGAQLQEGTYRPKAVRRVMIPKPGSEAGRPLGIPCVSDRVVQTALRNVMEPIFEVGFADCSYGFRPGRSCKDALRRVDHLLKSGYRVVVDADLKQYFDTIPHEPLLERIRAKTSDGRLLQLIEMFLKQEVMDLLKQWTPEQGSPQGAVVSPLLSNIYLDAFDHHMMAHGFELVRYCDDFVILCRGRAEAEKALEAVTSWMGQAGLELHAGKTRIASVDENETFAFLGYEFGRKRRWPRKKSLTKLKDAIRSQTPRKSGKSLSEIISLVNKSLAGWFEYFKHSFKWVHDALDAWVRMRLRSILRRRRRGQGRGRGADHLRWPNAFFANRGLFSLAAAYDEAVNPLKG